MGKDHKLVSKKWKMVIFKLGETNVKMKWSACHNRGTKKNLSAGQNSNLWPPKHRAGALSTWAKVHIIIYIKRSFNFAFHLFLGVRIWTNVSNWNLVSSFLNYIQTIQSFLIVSSPAAKSS